MQPPFRVVYTSELREQLDVAVRTLMVFEPPVGQRVFQAVKRLDQRLKDEARTLGEPRFDLRDAHLQVRVAAEAPVVFFYAVHEELPIVFVTNFRLLQLATPPGDPL